MITLTLAVGPYRWACAPVWLLAGVLAGSLSKFSQLRSDCGIVPMTKSDFDMLCATGAAAGPVNAQEIMRAQDELGVVLPREYLAFLGEFGAVVANGVEMYGLNRGDENRPPLWQNVVFVAKQLRQWGQDGTEQKAFVPISEDGTGVYFFLNAEVPQIQKFGRLGRG